MCILSLKFYIVLLREKKETLTLNIIKYKNENNSINFDHNKKITYNFNKQLNVMVKYLNSIN